MLRPAEIAAYHDGNSLGGIVSERDKIQYSNLKFMPGVSVKEEIFPSAPSKFRGPCFVKGAPFDEGCLNGVGAKVVDCSSVSLFEVRNFRCVGYEALLVDDEVLLDLCASSSIDRYKSKSKSMHSGYLYEVDEDSLVSLKFLRPSSFSPVKGCGAIVYGLESGNYGAFLFRLLPQVLMLRKHVGIIDYLVVPDKKSWMLNLLTMVGLDFCPIFSFREVAGLVLDRAFVIGHVESEAFFHPSIKNEIAEFAKQIGSHERGEARKIYVSRRFARNSRPKYRPLVNEEQVEELVSGMGFSIIYPELLTFSQQVKVFYNSDFLVGPSGSGMLNAVFACAGARVLDMESHSNTVRQHAHLYSSSEKQYGFIFGDVLEPEKPVFSPWSVCVGDLSDAIFSL